MNAPHQERRRGDSLYHSLRAIARKIQHRAAAAIGIDETARTETVVTMLDNNRRRAPGYWIQLTLAAGIATLGLVLNSTAVVIGAMLVSPLMGPILELAMGFAVGSPFLTLRAAYRVLLSVLLVTAGAAMLTVALPFHEVTQEIAVRTAPTALDLLVAVFCALTAAYTTVRPASDTAAAAAGTAIGIALVPPLCVVGFGLGTGSTNVAGGAAMLFTANLSAILVLAVLSFFLLGYDQVDAETFEAGAASSKPTMLSRLASRSEDRLRRAFGSRYGTMMRLVVPAIFLGGVYVPLSRALDEVTWEVRSRDAIRRILGREAPRAVQTSVNVERHTVSLSLVVLASDEQASALEGRLGSLIGASTGVTPTIAVTAVPDAEMLGALTRQQLKGAKDHLVDLAETRRRLTATIEGEWPAAAGPLAGWELVVPAASTPAITVYHVGPPLGQAGAELLGRRWAAVIGGNVTVRDEAIPSDVISAPLGQERRWLDRARPLLAWVTRADRGVVCIRAPIDSARRRSAAQRATVDSLRASAAAGAGRVSITDSSGWSLGIAVARCDAVVRTSRD